MKSIIFNLANSEYLAKALMNHTEKVTYGRLREQKFSDGELCVDFIDSVRGNRIYILSSPNNSDEIIKLNLAIDAAKRGDAEEIIPILTYYPYQRSDKKDQSRGPIGAKVIAEMLEQRGATSIITFDLHADQIQGFFNIPVIHIEGKTVFDEYISTLNTDDLVLSSCDAGGVKRVKRMVTRLKDKYDLSLNYVVIDKVRVKANLVESVTIIGAVKGKNVLLIDDMIDTFGSADKAVDSLLDNGAKSVSMIASHGVLSGPALDRIANSKLSKLIISDSLPKIDKTHDAFQKIKIISVSQLIGKAIKAINENCSYESLIN